MSSMKSMYEVVAGSVITFIDYVLSSYVFWVLMCAALIAATMDMAAIAITGQSMWFK